MPIQEREQGLVEMVPAFGPAGEFREHRRTRMENKTTTTPQQVNDSLAEFMGWHKELWDGMTRYYIWVNQNGELMRRASRWNPCTDRNDLAIVLGEVEKRGMVGKIIYHLYRTVWVMGASVSPALDFAAWLLTRPPETIARAVAEVIEKQKSR